MSDPLFVERDGHRTRLKWHRGRRRGTDPAFTGRRILEAMRIGASVEVDLVVTGDKGLAVLHDLTLDRETTGTGPVAATSDAAVRQLRLRDDGGMPTDEPVMLLDDLCALIVQGPPHPDALLQLDYKQDETVLDARAIAAFRRATLPVAGNIIVSSGSAAAVRLLADAVPGMRIGFDPSDEQRFKAALASGTLDRFVEDAAAASPDAELVYLHHEIITRSSDAGFDIVEAFHQRGRRIDAWTIHRVNETSLALANRLLALRVDQITTDDPEGLADALEVG